MLKGTKQRPTGVELEEEGKWIGAAALLKVIDTAEQEVDVDINAHGLNHEAPRDLHVHDEWRLGVTCFVSQAFVGFAVLSHAKVDGFQGGVLILTQVQEILWLDVSYEDVPGMALGHCSQNLSH